MQGNARRFIVAFVWLTLVFAPSAAPPVARAADGRDDHDRRFPTLAPARIITAAEIAGVDYLTTMRGVGFAPDGDRLYVRLAQGDSPPERLFEVDLTAASGPAFRPVGAYEFFGGGIGPVVTPDGAAALVARRGEHRAAHRDDLVLINLADGAWTHVFECPEPPLHPDAPPAGMVAELVIDHFAGFTNDGDTALVVWRVQPFGPTTEYWLYECDLRTGAIAQRRVIRTPDDPAPKKEAGLSLFGSIETRRARLIPKGNPRLLVSEHPDGPNGRSVQITPLDGDSPEPLRRSGTMPLDTGPANEFARTNAPRSPIGSPHPDGFVIGVDAPAGRLWSIDLETGDATEFEPVHPGDLDAMFSAVVTASRAPPLVFVAPRFDPFRRPDAPEPPDDRFVVVYDPRDGSKLAELDLRAVLPAETPGPPGIPASQRRRLETIYESRVESLAASPDGRRLIVEISAAGDEFVRFAPNREHTLIIFDTSGIGVSESGN
ncbi:MAG: hypothetical protein ACF8PN_05135 [Phycisphaerales bacterium]